MQIEVPLSGTSKVSIAMCTYNGERFLSEQLDSILKQTYRNIELIIVDDCSTDGTLQVLERYSKQDDRIRVICNQTNLGFVRNFEKAMAACTSDLIALADQDDVWFPEKIESLYSEIGNNLLIYSKVEVIDSDSKKLSWDFPLVERIEGGCALSLILRNCVTGHACLMRRELLSLALPYMSDMPFHDQWLAISAASRGRLKAGEKVLSYYRLHDKNVIFSVKGRKKKKRKMPKYIANAKKTDVRLGLIKKVLESGVLLPDQEELLRQFFDLYKNNEHIFYNWRLRLFMKKYGASFLHLYPDKDKYISRLCRGKWYYFLMPVT